MCFLGQLYLLHLHVQFISHSQIYRRSFLRISLIYGIAIAHSTQMLYSEKSKTGYHVKIKEISEMLHEKPHYMFMPAVEPVTSNSAKLQKLCTV